MNKIKIPYTQRIELDPKDLPMAGILWEEMKSLIWPYDGITFQGPNQDTPHFYEDAPVGWIDKGPAPDHIFAEYKVLMAALEYYKRKEQRGKTANTSAGTPSIKEGEELIRAMRSFSDFLNKWGDGRTYSYDAL
ncbi:hypothetical protein D1872_51130 [compost metagenome]